MSLLKHFSLFLFLATAVAALSACAGARPLLTAPPPGVEAFHTDLKKEISSINVPIEASADDISRVLNKTVGRELYKGSTSTSGLAADVMRNGPIAVSASGNFIYLTLPITMSLSYGMFETDAIPLKLKFKATANITPDWKLNTEIYYLGLSDLLANDVRIGPFSLNPRSIMDGITRPVQQALSRLVSQKINEIFPLKNQIAKVWTAAYKPVLLDKRYNAWLKLAPQEVTFHPLYAQNNRIKISAGISTFAEMVVGPEPAAQPPLPLPRLKLVDNIDRDFHIALNADLYYRDLLNIATPLLLNKKFDSDGKTIIIKDLDLYGNGDRIVVKVATGGDLEGVFYLTGIPRFDPQTRIFSVGGVDFDIQSQSLLLQSADWVLHGTIKSLIQEKLNMDLTQRLEQSREMAQKAIAHVQLADHVLLKGNIKTLKFSDVLVHRDKISIQVYSEGDSAILFQ